VPTARAANPTLPAAPADPQPPAQTAERLVVLVALGSMTIGLAVLMVLSLRWRPVHDSPIFLFTGLQIDRFGAAPYRDMFDPAAPGTFLLFTTVGKVTGYTDLGFRLVDLLWTAALGAVTWRLMRRFGPVVAWATVVTYGLLYFVSGSAMSMQRDYLAVLPIAFATLLSLDAARARRPWVRYVAIGTAFGAAAMIKPQLGAGLAAVSVYLYSEARRAGPRDAAHPPARATAWGIAGPLVIGVAVVAGPVMAWLASTGGLDRCIEVFRRYTPLYLSLDGDHAAIDNRLEWLVRGTLGLGGHTFLLIPIAIAYWRLLRDRVLDDGSRRAALLLAALAATYAIVPASAGQFFSYHWMPFVFFAVATAALALRAFAGSWMRPVVVAILAASVLLHVSGDVWTEFGLARLEVASSPRADEIAAFLDRELEPGDTVQPLDWVNGAIHGMLIARAELATPYLHDYQFFHSVSDPFIATLRERFIDDFDRERPRFVIDVYDGRPRVTGNDTSTSFPELDALLAENYDVVHRGTGFDILEIDDDPWVSPSGS